jgi:hypothetical protein
VRGSWKKWVALSAVALAGGISGCSKKADYGADTTSAGMAAGDTMNMSASSTAPMMQDTANSTTPSKSMSPRTKTSTKKTTKKSTY